MTTSVSVIIPAHNVADTLARALLSVLAQTRQPEEIIVINDGSTDATDRIAEQFAKDGVETISVPRCTGPGHARNTGIARATGTVVAFLDADDEWLDDKLEKQIDLLDRMPDAALVACAAVHVSEDGRELAQVDLDRPVVLGPNAWKTLLAYSFLETPCVVARRAALIEAGLFNPKLPVAEDQDMWIRIAKIGNVAYVDETLVRVHDRPNRTMRRSLSQATEITIGMVNSHLRQSGSSLRRHERRWILGHRYAALGRQDYQLVSKWAGAKRLLHAALLGTDPLPTCFFWFRRPSLVGG